MPIFFAIPLLAGANGCRTMTPIAVLCWFAYIGRLHVAGTWAFWTANLISAIVFTVLALGEYIGDKLPQTPNRTDPPLLAGRAAFGALVGAIVVTSLHQSLAIGIVLGAVSAVAGAFAGFYARRFLTRDRKLPDFPIALAEDAITIGLAVFALHLVTA
jgi:uncharacterized membrane protein